MLSRIAQKVHLAKTMLIILVLAVCFIFAYIKDSQASDGLLRGVVQGKQWKPLSSELKRKVIDGIPTVVLEFSNRVLSDAEACKEIPGASKLLVEIPLSIENGKPNYENAKFKLPGASGLELPCMYDISLKAEELKNAGAAYVSGRLRMGSEKARTNIVGSFQSRVCN